MTALVDIARDAMAAAVTVAPQSNEKLVDALHAVRVALVTAADGAERMPQR